MKNRIPRLAAIAIALGLAAPIASAHNAWMMPSSTVMSKAQWITVDAAVSNDLFYFNHLPLQVQNLVITAPDGSEVKPENSHRGRLRAVFDVNLTQNGTYRIATVNKGVFASYKLGGERKRWRGTAEALEKEIPAGAEELVVTESAGRIETFVTVGKPTTYALAGSGLELKPVTHPNDLFSGEEASFVLMLDGKPAPQVGVTVVRGDTRFRDKVGEVELKTGDDGKFSFKWPEPGRYWLEVSFEDDKPTVKQASKRRFSYVATFEVLPQ